MEKIVISEIRRIHELMGVSNLLLEGGNPWIEFIELLAKKGTAAEGKFFRILEEAFKPLAGKITDDDINRIVKEIREKCGLTSDEANKLKKLLKEDTDFRNVLKSSGDYYEDLVKLQRKSAPAGADAIVTAASKVERMSVADMAAFSKKLVSSALRDPLSRLSRIYTKIVEVNSDWFTKMDELYGDGWILHNADEVYDRIDNSLNEYLRGITHIGDPPIPAGKISKEEAKQIFEEVSTEIRTNSTLKDKVDEMISQGRNANKNKRTKTVKYGDEPYGVEDAIKYKNNLVDWKTPPKIDDLKTGKLGDDVEPYIPVRKDDIFNSDDQFRNLTPDYFSNWTAFFTNYIKPWFYMWTTQIRNLFEVIWPKTLAQRKAEFLEAARRSFNEFSTQQLGSGSNFKKLASYREMMDKLLRFPKNSDIMIADAKGTVYDIIWDDFVEFGQKQFGDDADKLKEFQEFCADVQTRPRDSTG